MLASRYYHRFTSCSFASCTADRDRGVCGPRGRFEAYCTPARLAGSRVREKAMFKLRHY